MRVQFERKSEKTDHELIWGWLGLVSFVGMYAWLKIFGSSPLQCNFRNLTGYPCPTCGTTRSFVALTEGHLWDSFCFNPLALLFYLFAFGYVPYALAAVYLGLPRIRLGFSVREGMVIRVVLLVSVALVWGYLIVDGR